MYGAYIGGNLPSLRGKPQEGGPHKRTMSFFFQAIHPEALGVGTFKDRAAMEKNVADILKDILCTGNDKCMLPGQIEAEAAKKERQVRRPAVYRERGQGIQARVRRGGHQVGPVVPQES